MKKQFKLLGMLVAVMAMGLVTSCSQDDYFSDQPDGRDKTTRAQANPDGSYTIDFEDFVTWDPGQLAGPTSQGENYYSSAGDNQVMYIMDEDGMFVSEPNQIGMNDFSSGAIALSNWNYRTNISGKTGDWWYSWNNQCSVYNTNSTDGQNSGAGHSGDYFGVVFGYSDQGTAGWIDKPMFAFYDEVNFIDLYVCLNSYTYGVIKNGNTFGNIGEATPLEQMKGYFKVIMECYNSNDVLITTKEKLLADYRDGYQRIEPISTWQQWTIGVPGVQYVKFNFQGTDTDPMWGLNTPAYLCIDDITFR